MTSYQKRKQEIKNLKTKLEKATRFEQQLKEYILGDLQKNSNRKQNVINFMLKNSNYNNEILNSINKEV